MSDQQKKSVEKALNQILSKQSITPSVPYDEELVERRRQEIAQRDIATMVLEDTINTVTLSGKEGVTPVS
ncbi:hypothetical protein, partial [Neisseria sp. P0014.S004]